MAFQLPYAVISRLNRMRNIVFISCTYWKSFVSILWNLLFFAKISTGLYYGWSQSNIDIEYEYWSYDIPDPRSNSTTCLVRMLSNSSTASVGTANILLMFLFFIYHVYFDIFRSHIRCATNLRQCNLTNLLFTSIRILCFVYIVFNSRWMAWSYGNHE